MKKIITNIAIVIAVFLLLMVFKSIGSHDNLQIEIGKMQTRHQELIKAASSFSVLMGPNQPKASLEIRLNTEGIRFLSELFETEYLVPLETTREATLGSLQSVILVGEFFYVTDKSQAKIFKFDQNGQFMDLVAEPGWGPGELGDRGEVRRVFGDNFCFYDPGKGVIHLFNSEGQFFFSTPKPGDQTEYIIPRSVYFWSDPNQLVLAGIDSNNPSFPNHAVMKVHYTDRDGKKNIQSLQYQGGFGQRKDVLHQLIGKRTHFSAFARVGNSIWAGHPLSHEIVAYDASGKLIKVISPNCNNPTRIDEIKKLPKSKGKDNFLANLSSYTRDKCRNIHIVPVGNYVLVDHGNPGWLLLSSTGEQIASQHFRNNIGTVFDTHGEMLIMPLEYMGYDPSQKYLPSYERDISILREMEFPVTEDFESNENPVIKVAVLH